MFQPEVKLEFVRRYCSPDNGWTVFVDIDASEEGRTGGERTTKEARRVRRKMQTDAKRVRRAFKKLRVTVGGKREEWFGLHALPRVEGDRDIVAFHKQKKVHLIAEAEGASSGQPEQKLYKAIGQLVMAASSGAPEDWRRAFVLVVHGEKLAAHLARADALIRLGISALALDREPKADCWLFGAAPLPKLLSGELRVRAAAKLVEAHT